MWKCEDCGQENQDWAPFCRLCKARNPGSAPANEDLESMSPETLALRITQNIANRHFSDIKLSPLWALLPLFLIAATMGVYVLVIFMDTIGSSEYDIFEHFYIWGRNVLTIIFGMLLGLLVYRMLWRMNMHFDREERLRADIMAFLRSTARPGGREQEIVTDLLRLSAFDGQAITYEKRLNPKKWGFGIAILFVLGSLVQIMIYAMILYTDGRSLFDHGFIFYFMASIAMYLIAIAGLVFMFFLASHLTRTVYTHELRWRGFTGTATAVLRRLGITVEVREPSLTLKERSVPLYVILTLVTLGIFGMYWLYTLIEDPNRHFRAQHDFEDELIRKLSARDSRA